MTIGIFVTHGIVPARQSEGATNTTALADPYARFLLNELLPEAETKSTADGRKIIMSKKGNDRAIGGSSCGAVCAFTAPGHAEAAAAMRMNEPEV